MRAEKGFTLIEVLVATTCSTILFLALFSTCASMLSWMGRLNSALERDENLDLVPVILHLSSPTQETTMRPSRNLLSNCETVNWLSAATFQEPIIFPTAASMILSSFSSFDRARISFG